MYLLHTELSVCFLNIKLEANFLFYFFVDVCKSPQSPHYQLPLKAQRQPSNQLMSCPTPPALQKLLGKNITTVFCSISLLPCTPREEINAFEKQLTWIKPFFWVSSSISLYCLD